MKTQDRAYAAAHFLLTLDQKDVAGFVKSVEGGGVKSEIITHKVGPQHGLFRQLGKPKYADLKIQVGMSMSDSFYAWLESFFAGKVVRRNGAISAADFNYKEKARREFFEGLISELAFPKLDAEDRNACHMTVTVVPERMRFAKGDEKKIKGGGLNQHRQKLWTAANFTFTIDGFEDACRRVSKVDAFSIKQQILTYQAGNLRDAIRVPGRLEFPNLTFYVPEIDAGPFVDAFTKRVINGEPPPATRLGGAITMLDHKSKELCTITLAGIDIAGVDPDKSEAGGEKIKEVKVEISVESMKIKYARS